MLVATPLPDLTESLMGYVLRLTEANGYPTSTYILGAMRKRKYQGTAERFDAQALVEIAGIDAVQAQRLSMRFAGRDNKGTIALCGQPVSRHHMKLNQPRVCTLCLDEHGRCEGFWELSLAVACPIHEVNLTDRCRRCRQPLSWHRTAPWKCKCGADLRRQRPARCRDRSTLGLMETLRALLYQAPLPPPERGFTRLADLGFEPALKLVAHLCKELAQQGRRDRAVDHYASHVPQAAQLLSDWPRNFRILLAKRNARLDSSETLPLFKERFGSFMTIFRSVDRSFAEQAVLEMQQFASKYWPAIAIAPPGKNRLASPDLFRWGSKQDLVAITGMHAATLRRYLKDSHVPVRYVATSRGGRRKRYCLDWARKMASLRSVGVMERTAAKQIGMTVRVLRELRAAGIYEAVHFGDGKVNVYTEADLGCLATRIMRVALRATPTVGETKVDLSSALKSSRRTPKRKAEFVAAILDRKVRAWNLGSNLVGDLLVSRAAVDRFFLGH